MFGKLWSGDGDCDSAISGMVKSDRRTKNLTKRLTTGDIAVIDHEDIDRVSAEALVECRPLAVLNAAKSTSGKYPNPGPEILLSAGIPLIDNLGEKIMDIPEGTTVEILHTGEVLCEGTAVAQGTVQTEETNRRDLEIARRGIPALLKAFAANTMEYVEKEQDLILDGVGVPKNIKTNFKGRHALVVVRGYQYKEDLEALRHYVRECRPVIIGVDGGADAVLQAGYKPDMIVGDMDSVSDQALLCGAEIIVHAYRDGRAPGKKRVENLGVDYVVFPVTGTSEDVAMLIADDRGAELIVAVGTHSTLIEYLDKGRKGMASTFLTRLQVGAKLIDAKGVSRLYRARIPTWPLVLLAAAGVLAIGAAMYSTSAGQVFFGLVQVWISDAAHWFKGLFRW